MCLGEVLEQCRVSFTIDPGELQIEGGWGITGPQPTHHYEAKHKPTPKVLTSLLPPLSSPSGYSLRPPLPHLHDGKEDGEDARSPIRSFALCSSGITFLLGHLCYSPSEVVALFLGHHLLTQRLRTSVSVIHPPRMHSLNRPNYQPFPVQFWHDWYLCAYAGLSHRFLSGN
jgi:hypothetical protein